MTYRQEWKPWKPDDDWPKGEEIREGIRHRYTRDDGLGVPRYLLDDFEATRDRLPPFPCRLLHRWHPRPYRGGWWRRTCRRCRGLNVPTPSRP